MFDSADLDSTVEGIVDAIWFNQGQVSYPVQYISVDQEGKVYLGYRVTM